ncbi:MAG: winged helix-turn-helix transcriptional regulator [Flavobacteriaceae bacterium]|nr:winged helix-turn-helix transcriptional regulator [Flavobacteriaceae bacterium]
MKMEKIDHIDYQILELLVQNTRIPFTQVAKKLNVSNGTVHVRVKKLLDSGVILGTNLNLDYVKLGFPVMSYVGVYLSRTNRNVINGVLKKLKEIPFITTISHVDSGSQNIFCKVRTRDNLHLKEIIFNINEIKGVRRTESFISMEEVINDKSRLLDYMFKSISHS